MDSKFPEQSKTIQTDFVLPADTNSLNLIYAIKQSYQISSLY